MSNLRISTLSLTLATALITLGFVNPAYAAKPDKPCPGHPSCDEGDGTAVVYTAELQGAFVIGTLVVTLEGQDDRLRPNEDAIMYRDDSDDQAAWDNVFSMPDPDNMSEPVLCNLFGPPGSVDSFTAIKKQKQVKGWRISRPGGVYVQFGGELDTDPGSAAEGASVHVVLQLWGDCAYSGGTDPDCDPFLPEPATDYDNGYGPGVSVIELRVYQIHATALKGEPQFEGCHDASNDLSFPSKLVITATAP